MPTVAITPVAPKDWSVANVEPAATAPILLCTPAAIEPPAIPAVVKPAAVNPADAPKALAPKAPVTPKPVFISLWYLLECDENPIPYFHSVTKCSQFLSYKIKKIIKLYNLYLV